MSEAAGKTVFVHIGHYKTGSSALQDFLHSSTDALKASGYLYPSGCRPKRNHTNHGQLSLSLASDYGFTPPQWYGEEIATDDAYATFRAEIENAAEKNVIISSEEFVQLALRKNAKDAVADLKERLAPYDVKIVLYLREPFSLLKSWYNQVNKGPVGTRNFPSFFMKLAPGFLNQHRIWAFYAKTFGRENMILKTYKRTGSEHIGEFLRAIGCDCTPPAGTDLVNPAQDIRKLELIRLSKTRRHSYQDATVTGIGDIRDLIKRVRSINERFDEVAALSDEPILSQLTPARIIRHYIDLIRPARKVTPLNQDEADRLRDLAIQAEQIDLELAIALMEAAQVIRPTGAFINEKLEAYRSELA